MKFTRIRNGLLVDALKVVDDVRLAPNTQFNEVRTAEKTQLIELKSTYGISTAFRDRTTTTGTATVTNSPGDGEYKLSTTAVSSSALLESAERGRYIPGIDAEAGLGIRIPAAPDGDRVVEWGYFDDQNGLKFGQDADGVYVAVVRDGTETEKVYQASWNADVLNGTGGSINPSGITLDTASGNIYQVVFAWYGYGTIEWRVILPDSDGVQRSVVVHRHTPSEKTSIKDPNLPISAKVTSGAGDSATYDVYVGGRQFSVVGTFNPGFRISSEAKTAVSVGTASWVPLVSMRRKTAYVGAAVKMAGVDVISNQNIQIAVFLDATLTDASFGSVSNIADTETAVEADTSATALSGGTAIFKGLVNSGGGGQSTLRASDLPPIDLPNSDEVTLAAKAISMTATVSAVMRVREQW